MPPRSASAVAVGWAVGRSVAGSAGDGFADDGGGVGLGWIAGPRFGRLRELSRSDATQLAIARGCFAAGLGAVFALSWTNAHHATN